jgi:allantoin racemase
VKILIINPNSDREMTAAILETAEKFARGQFEVLCQSTPSAPEFIETYEDGILAAPGMIDLVRKNDSECDAFIIACHCDPNLDVLKETTKKPVVGIGEASMRIASMVGHRFSVIQTTETSVPLKEALVRKYGLQDALASIRALNPEQQKMDEDKKYMAAARAAMEEDRADVIVLGCAGLTGMDKRLQNELGIPVLDGVVCGLTMALGLIQTNVASSQQSQKRDGF